MIHNYLKLFFRTLAKQKLFSFINLLGLTVSFVSALLIYLYARHELSFDQFHPFADRLYRVNQTFIWGEDDQRQFASTGPGVATALRQELSEAEVITSVHTPGDFIVSYESGGKSIAFEEKRILAADTNFFEMFHFPMVKGDKATALQLPNRIVITQTTAQKYFGQQDPLGKTLQLSTRAGEQSFEVSGVVSDTPDNSYIEFDGLISMASIPAVDRLHWSWVWTQLETFVRLKENVSVEDARATLARIPQKYAEETLQRVMNTSFAEYSASGKKWELFLQPITDIHLPQEVVYNRLNESGSRKIVYTMMGIAGFILLLACVNFMNLSTAQFTRRVKEASVRKLMGLGRLELSGHYFLEACLYCVLAAVLALALVQLVLPIFNQLTGKAVGLMLFEDGRQILLITGLVITMAILASSYPTIFLTGFRPIEGLKGKVSPGTRGRTFRHGLVVFQFAISMILLICTATVFQQLRYVSTKDIGFNKENLLVLHHAELLSDSEVLTESAKTIPGVAQATTCTSLPPRVWGGDKFSAEGMGDQTFSLNYTSADENFVPTLSIRVKHGRNFSKETPGDFERVMVNESAIRRMGWALDESAIGRKIQTPGGEVKFEVIGIVADFNYWSLENPIEPMAIFHHKSQNLSGVGQKKYIALRIEPTEASAVIDGLQRQWKTHAGDAPFEYEFVDQAFAATFKTQEQFGSVLTVLSSLAILIAALGLLGMIIYALEQRTKEIGIRLVSGASSFHILSLFSKDYMKLMLLAFLFAAPLAFWLMEQWLVDFSYRISPSMWIFAAVGLVNAMLALLIISYNTVKASRTSPVTILRDE